jgi:iron-sulfur cluster assembly accessory protein
MLLHCITIVWIKFFAQSILHLSGTELDYKDELMQSAFVFNNPNIKGTCGCGTSFHT